MLALKYSICLQLNPGCATTSSLQCPLRLPVGSVARAGHTCSVPVKAIKTGKSTGKRESVLNSVHAYTSVNSDKAKEEITQNKGWKTFDSYQQHLTRHPSVVEYHTPEIHNTNSEKWLLAPGRFLWPLHRLIITDTGSWRRELPQLLIRVKKTNLIVN